MRKEIVVMVLLALLATGCERKEERETTGALPEETTGTTAQGEKQTAVVIQSPQDGATLPANKPFVIEYAVQPSENGDHVHIYVDDGSPAVVNSLEGSYTLEGLPPGEHTLRVEEVTSGHSPTGQQASITVTAQ